ncbi:hypothetical protein BV25DRAFT_127126 [Artomyces pyxidatus]|uniref:Uncharacterized protein n=1 Tax=Artomyces pyxidatus TaxID=48021 RepID=A0ACB8T906_9AGAM|nr:hypothetical protein BV25DRAFT_127126 [Artomyces pyxidatus]
MDIRVALDAIVDVQKSQYAGVSSSVIILYDHVLTLDREIQLVWFESWSIGKVLFLACRYYWTFAAIFNDYALMSSWHKSEPVSDFWISWQGWTTVFVAGALTEVILLLRIRALYAGDRRLTVPLLAGLIVTMTICGTIMGKSLHEKTTLFIVAGPHVFCAFGNIPPYLSAFFLPLMAFESLLGGLAIYKWIKEVGVTLASPRIAPALLRVLVRDSVIYFIVMTLSYVVTAVVWFEAPVRSCLLQ